MDGTYYYHYYYLYTDSQGLRVVSIGGGDGLVSKGSSDGRILTDSRAITLARRAFIKYILIRFYLYIFF